MFCTECEFNNTESAKYCQCCGKKLARKKSIRNTFKGADIGSLAGMGQKGVSLAPLLSDTAQGKQENVPLQRKVVLKKTNMDRFYCTYCGAENRKGSYTCNDCGNDFSFQEE